MKNKLILVISTLALLFIIVLGIIFMMQKASRQNNNSSYSQPTPISGNQTLQITPVKPPVEYQKGSIDREVNAITDRRAMSSSDTATREKLIQITGGVSGILTQSNNYTIKYVKPLDVFESEIISTDITGAKREVIAWFENQGISGDGICKLPVTFYLNRTTAEQLHGKGIIFNPLPDGC